jgi:selenide,water dikinase
VDFFTPIVDEPRRFGEVAAANSLSDIYAMGAKPLLAMNVVCYPCGLGMDVLREILAGGADKVYEAGALLVGGHSVDDREPKYGLSVTGTVHPDKVVRNKGVRPGDMLVLTKPLGTGIVSTAVKAEMSAEGDAELLWKVMSTLNARASEVMQQVGPTACTDVTGFGFIGHLTEMAQASGVSVEVAAGEVPALATAIDYARSGLVPGGLHKNKEFYAPVVRADGVDEFVLELMFDPQTSGGLLISVPEHRVDQLMRGLSDVGLGDWCGVVGRAAPARADGVLIAVRDGRW